jgi:hypothetical protein
MLNKISENLKMLFFIYIYIYIYIIYIYIFKILDVLPQ